MSRYAPHERERIIQITMQIVASMIEKGEVDPDDESALRKASKEAAAIATAAYNAALEFISG